MLNDFPSFLEKGIKEAIAAIIHFNIFRLINHCKLPLECVHCCFSYVSLIVAL